MSAGVSFYFIWIHCGYRWRSLSGFSAMKHMNWKTHSFQIAKSSCTQLPARSGCFWLLAELVHWSFSSKDMCPLINLAFQGMVVEVELTAKFYLYCFERFHLKIIRDTIIFRHTGIPELSTQVLDSGLWTLDSWHWALDSGRWVLVAEFWMLDSGRSILGAGLWMLDSGCWTLDVGLWTLDSGCWTLDAGLLTLNSERWTVDPGHWTLDAGLRMLDSCCWSLHAGLSTLDSGCWTLDAGLSTLDSGRWTLDSGRCTLGSKRWTLDAGRYT